MKQIIFILTLIITLASCEQDAYLIDGGLSDPNVGTTTMNFLKSHPQLDTLAILLEKAGLNDEADGAVTLFAPNNLSIRNYVNAVLAEMREIDPLAVYTVNDIPVDTLTKYLGAYIIPSKIRREDMTKEGAIYTAIDGSERRISLEPSVTSYANNLSTPPEYVYYTYRKGADWDAWDTYVDDMKVLVRTSNLISTNGVIHVLQGTHILFNYDPD
jgi:uncharacterized surface protein with fasciclin (FAS1) repeats